MKSIKKNVLKIIATIMMMGFVTSVMAQVPETQHENETYPQEQQQPDQQILQEDEQDHMNSEEEGVLPQEQNQMGEIEYTAEIEENELPQTVTTSIETMYPDHKIEKVYRGTDDSFKVKVKNGDEKSVLYYDSEGTFVKEKDDHDHEHKDKNKDW